MVYVSIAALFLGITVNIYSIPLLHFYTSGEEALAVGILRLRLVNLPYILCGLMEVSGAVSSGTGYSFPPMIISVIGVSGLRILWVLTFFQIHRRPRNKQFPAPSGIFNMNGVGIFL